MKKLPRISEAEWQVMQELWAAPDLTADELIDRLKGKVTWSGATIRTLINRLLKKEALTYQTEGRKYRYRPAFPQERHDTRVGPLAVLAEDRKPLDRVVVISVTKEIHRLERHWTVLLYDELRRTSARPHPSGELLAVGDRRRQVDELDIARQMDDRLLPYRAAIAILEVVDFVQNHHAEAVEGI